MEMTFLLMEVMNVKTCKQKRIHMEPVFLE